MPDSAAFLPAFVGVDGRDGTIWVSQTTQNNPATNRLQHAKTENQTSGLSHQARTVARRPQEPAPSIEGNLERL